MATAPESLADERTPVFCQCGSRPGFVRSQVTGYWNCARCGHPTEAWWRGQVALIDRLARKGRCSKDAGVHSFKRRKCDGYEERT
jgi:hypothetical protein